VVTHIALTNSRVSPVMPICRKSHNPRLWQDPYFNGNKISQTCLNHQTLHGPTNKSLTTNQNCNLSSSPKPLQTPHHQTHHQTINFPKTIGPLTTRLIKAITLKRSSKTSTLSSNCWRTLNHNNLRSSHSQISGLQSFSTMMSLCQLFSLEIMRICL
jgi:hypothetical protein